MNAQRSRTGDRSQHSSATPEDEALLSTKPERVLRVVETCHSTWIFDEQAHRFRRVLKGPSRDRVSTDWRAYDHLVIGPGSDAFLVFLDATGVRVLRSTPHSANCRRCGQEQTTELSLEDLRALLDD